MGTDHVIIAHGKSEVLLFWGLFTRFDIDANIFSLENGERGIPMSHLPQVLSERPFITERMLADRWRGLDYRSGHIPGLGIFPVVDHDCDDRNLRSYISDDLFRECPLSNRAVPIINRPNLDSIFSASLRTSCSTDSGRSIFRALKVKGAECAFTSIIRSEIQTHIRP